MRFDEAHLVQDLLVLRASERGDEIVVSLYGGRQNACGSVTFHFPAALERRRMLRVLQRWAEQDEPVTLLTRGSRISLFSERAVLRRALESA